MAEQAIIIVDDYGREHHFPAGMDVKRAIQVVRNSQLEEANRRPLHEPTTETGGILKGLKDYATEFKGSDLMDMLGHAAKPQNMGDFLTLALPSAVGMARPSVALGSGSDIPREPIGNRAVRAGARGLANVADLTPNIMRSKTEGRVVDAIRRAGQTPPPPWLDRNLPNRSGYTPEPTAPAESHPIGQQGFNELPLHEQMNYMGGGSTPESTRSGGPPIANLGRETVSPPSPAEAPRLAGQAPKLEEVLQQALEEALANKDTQTAGQLRSLAPDIQTAGEGATSQTGTFKRSESLGQPGGYSSGRPGLTPQQYDDLLKRKGMEPPPEQPPGGGGPPTTLDEALIEHDPGAMAGRAQDLRSQLGSRDAARQIFGTGNPVTQDWIRTMAPGPSRMPTEAQRRIEDAILKALEGEGK